MSNRETQLKPLVLTGIGGVNQRAYETELKPHEYSTVEGVFPEFAGLQSRAWGKRLLQKYNGAIYGIHQFWTPLGYGGGLYQFTGTLDYGYWLTPTSKFDLSLPSIGYDGGSMTLDEFGYPYGSNFGYGTDNLCLISFLNGSTDHSVCNENATGAGATNDSNGGPAGQGSHCRWELSPTVIAYGKSIYEIGTDGANTNGNEGALPYPKPLTVSASKPSNFVAGQGTYGANLVALTQAESTKVNIGGGTYHWTEDWSSYDQKAVLDLSNGIINGQAPVLVVMTFARNPNAPFTFFDAPLNGIDWSADGNFAAYPFDPWDYLDTNAAEVSNGNGGFTKADFINGGVITAYHNRRICS